MFNHAFIFLVCSNSKWSFIGIPINRLFCSRWTVNWSHYVFGKSIKFCYKCKQFYDLFIYFLPHFLSRIFFTNLSKVFKKNRTQPFPVGSNPNKPWPQNDPSHSQYSPIHYPVIQSPNISFCCNKKDTCCTGIFKRQVLNFWILPCFRFWLAFPTLSIYKSILIFP